MSGSGREVAAFPTTHWSLVQSAGASDAGRRRRALADLLTHYLTPMNVYISKRWRVDAHRAEDLAQQFISDKLLERGIVRRASQGKGRFRAFLLKSLDRFILNQFRKSRARKRAPDRAGSLESLERTSKGAAPAELFDRAWAQHVLEEAMARMRAACEASARAHIWHIFNARLVGPLLHGEPVVDYRVLVDRYGLRSPSEASNALVTANRMFLRTLRQVVGVYEKDDEQIEEEIRDLRKILALGAG
jgi:DNA-directed RNA polymerase specialized sigma24 family protein